MPKVNVLQCDAEELSYCFFCKGCECSHFFRTRSTDPEASIWSWNGNFDKPTVHPSIDVNRSHPEKRCHFFIENGKIRYLFDSFHYLKGQVVDMEEDD